jgi:hypothetical protein
MIELAPGAARVDFEASEGDILLLPGPLDLFGLISDLTIDGLELLDMVPSNFGPQQAAVVRAQGTMPSARYRWTRAAIEAEHGWLWHPPDHRLARASAELTRQIGDLRPDSNPWGKEGAAMSHVASSFRYGHGDDRFTDGATAVPALSCGLTRGSCVDIHTYAVAALRSAGIGAAYVAGVFWPDGETVAKDMHCWIVTGEGGGRFWDVSHDIIAGRTPQPDLLARPGRRLPFAIGRGQCFSWRDRAFEISHFALPHLVTTSGAVETASKLTFDADAV